MPPQAAKMDSHRAMVAISIVIVTIYRPSNAKRIAKREALLVEVIRVRTVTRRLVDVIRAPPFMTWGVTKREMVATVLPSLRANDAFGVCCFCHAHVIVSGAMLDTQFFFWDGFPVRCKGCHQSYVDPFMPF